jgi:hypothetical protein
MSWSSVANGSMGPILACTHADHFLHVVEQRSKWIYDQFLHAVIIGDKVVGHIRCVRAACGSTLHARLGLHRRAAALAVALYAPGELCVQGRSTPPQVFLPGYRCSAPRQRWQVRRTQIVARAQQQIKNSKHTV